jgi:hypothetical protein
MNKRQMMDEINNFIEYYTSSDDERQKMSDTLLDYMLDVYEDKPKEVYFIREGNVYRVKSEDAPQYYIPVDEKENYISQYMNLKRIVHVG